MSPVISVSHLSKHYRLGLIGSSTLREDLERWWARMRGRPDPLALVDQEGASAGFRDSKSNIRNGEIWALRHVSFEVQQGEVLGIIGRNGAGKSTLLKILSQVTAPTEGCAKIRGRVASLLEVGTGFHPELTGRENIYLNGAILGMRRAEIDRKFDEIVAFAEVERFIDTPVKRYSSGMYVRLAFAVAAHLEPEILLVDEVLAVGDAAFQKKCLGKMGAVAQGGRTVLFVSHNMAAIESLCPRTCLLDQGGVATLDATSAVLDRYLNTISRIATSDLGARRDRSGNGQLRFLKAQILRDGKPTDTAFCGDDVTIAIRYEALPAAVSKAATVAVSVYDHRDHHLFTCWSVLTGTDLVLGPAGCFLCGIPRLPLTPGRYFYNLYSEVGGVLADWVIQAGTLDVVAGDFFGTGRLPPPTHGGLLIEHRWAMGDAGPDR